MPPNVYDHKTPADIQNHAAVLTSEKPVSTDLSEVESEYTVDDVSNDSVHDSDPSSDRSDEYRSKKKDVIYVGSADSSSTILSNLGSSGSSGTIELPDEVEAEGDLTEDPDQQNGSDGDRSEISIDEESEASNPEKALDEINPHGFYSDDPEIQEIINTELKEWVDLSEAERKELFEHSKEISVSDILKMSLVHGFCDFMVGLYIYHGMNPLHQGAIAAIEAKKTVEKIDSPKERDEKFQVIYEYCGRFLRYFYGASSKEISPLPWDVKILPHPEFEYDQAYIGKTVVELIEKNFQDTPLENIFKHLAAKDYYRKNSIFYKALTQGNEEIDRRRDKAAEMDLEGDSRAEGFFRLPEDSKAEQNSSCAIL